MSACGYGRVRESEGERHTLTRGEREGGTHSHTPLEREKEHTCKHREGESDIV